MKNLPSSKPVSITDADEASTVYVQSSRGRVMFVVAEDQGAIGRTLAGAEMTSEQAFTLAGLLMEAAVQVESSSGPPT